MINPQRALPNFLAATRHTDSKISAVAAGARSNPELASALAHLDGYTEADQRIDKLGDGFKDWQDRLAGTAAVDSHTAIVAAIDDGTLDKLPALLAKESNRTEVLHTALVAAATAGGRLRSEQAQMIHDGVDTMLGALDTRLRQVVAELAEHSEELRGITTAEDAIEAGVSDAWSGRKSAHESVAAIRAAQTVILRNLASDLHQWLAADDRRMLAVGEVEDWKVIDKRLPQIMRHGGIWSKDRHKSREEERVERWAVPWPQDKAARTAWLLEHRPEQLRVPSLQAMDEGREKLQQLTARATPTGDQAEPTSLVSAEPINKRSLR